MHAEQSLCADLLAAKTERERGVFGRPAQDLSSDIDHLIAAFSDEAEA